MRWSLRLEHWEERLLALLRRGMRLCASQHEAVMQADLAGISVSRCTASPAVSSLRERECMRHLTSQPSDTRRGEEMERLPRALGWASALRTASLLNPHNPALPGLFWVYNMKTLLPLMRSLVA